MQMDFRALYNMSTNTPSASYNAYNKFLNLLPPSERYMDDPLYETAYTASQMVTWSTMSSHLNIGGQGSDPDTFEP